MPNMVMAGLIFSACLGCHWARDRLIGYWRFLSSDPDGETSQTIAKQDRTQLPFRVRTSYTILVGGLFLGAKLA